MRHFCAARFCGLWRCPSRVREDGSQSEKKKRKTATLRVESVRAVAAEEKPCTALLPPCMGLPAQPRPRALDVGMDHRRVCGL